jgi:methanogenic corrinoid protein MtbC1
MDFESMVERLFECLINGDRPGAKSLVLQARSAGVDPRGMVTDIFWPAYQTIDRLYRADQLGCLNHHMAVRLLRVLVDQNAAQIEPAKSRNRTVFACCGPSESEELGAQMALDILEGAGFTVTFGGSRIANDEILATVNENKPDVLLMFASAPEDLPLIRQLIDTLNEIGAHRSVQVAVGGGVFARAEGLAEEIGADVWAHSPMELVETLIGEPTRRAAADQRTVGRTRRRQREAA